MSAGRILIVDDDESSRSTLNDYFSGMDYEIVTAQDGEDAIRKFSPGKFDCVISDLVMPNIDGLELLKLIKHQDAKVFFLMITGFPSIDRAVEAIKEGAYDYVTKPFHMEDLRIKVERMLESRKAEKSLKTMTAFFWAVMLSVPVWLFLGIILGIIWK